MVVSLQPNIKVISPWREWNLSSRTNLIKYAEENQIKVPKDKRGEAPFSVDANLLHISAEGKILEDPWVEPEEFIFSRTKSPFEAPNKPRKLKGLFGSAEEPTKDCEYTAAAAVKSFKAYIYSLRNNIVEMAPSGWSLSEIEESPVLQKLAKRSLNPLDFL